MSAASWIVTIVVVLAVIGSIWLAVLSTTRASRLHRLHIRGDLARGALRAALDRRVDVVRAIARADPDAHGAQALLDAADAAAAADLASREAPENLLSTAIAYADADRRPSELTADLTDAQIRVGMARRFYNDAVRDTRNLRGRRMVRWLHLAGHAPMPAYFEITERVTRG
ncbi:NUDIX hydrolase [Gordonia humi]|uniref:NUDIX hydrolase n=1 Tax=Gordonia humi TaxID=686429 RepID=A0A840FAJ1_9ACTN|nr:NUDIX hydrolase [Gordonia humi]MBB4136527.1 hypothetical protein [Gordonia humi]